MSEALSSVPVNAAPSLAVFGDVVQAVDAAFSAWSAASAQGPDKLVILLQNHYQTWTEGRICIPTLEGWDAHVYPLIIEAARRHGLYVGFATLKYYISGAGYDLNHPHYFSSRYTHAEAEEAMKTYVCDESNLGIEEVNTHGASLHDLVDLRGNLLNAVLAYSRDKEGIYHHVFVPDEEQNPTGQEIDSEDRDYVSELIYLSVLALTPKS
jgi:hypothetical protein